MIDWHADAACARSDRPCRRSGLRAQEPQCLRRWHRPGRLVIGRFGGSSRSCRSSSIRRAVSRPTTCCCDWLGISLYAYRVADVPRLGGRARIAEANELTVEEAEQL